VSLTSLTIQRRPRRRRGFNLIEMLIALAITAALLSATMVALDASFMAYQTTTEVASTHTISRLVMLRLMTLIRTGHGMPSGSAASGLYRRRISPKPSNVSAEGSEPSSSPSAGPK